MKILITHPDQQQHAASLAQDLSRVLPEARVASTNQAEAEGAELVVAVFTLKPGSFAPTVPFFRELRDRKVAFVALLAGPVDAGRVRKCVWGVKKQFCGNEVIGAYLCSSEDEGPSAAERAKAQAFALKCRDRLKSAFLTTAAA